MDVFENEVYDFELLWNKQSQAVENLGWEPLTEREKRAAYWGWRVALSYATEKKDKNNA